ncbi:MAG: Gfo/Idh/MocA family oxidoreductase [Chloroflexi bacterium]|nr:Gfo/Idh/MocA family oxidoreductase [Chloroflexota bacterium]
MASEKVKLGIVGLGNMGLVHVGHVMDLPNTDLVAVCDTNERKLQAAKAGSGVARFRDYRQMLDSTALDGVIIATPHYDHPDMSIAALERGIHVLVEKPIAVHVNEARRMIDAHHSFKRRMPNLVFAAMFMQRTWGHWRKIKAMIERGELGRLIRCTWIITDWFRTQYYYDSGGWRATWSGEGGGVLMNQCPHNLDLYQWLVGAPSRIHGFASFGKHHQIEVEDEATAYLEHDNGMIGHFITTTGESPGTNRLEIIGENGKLVYDASPPGEGGSVGGGAKLGGEIIFYRNQWSSIKHLRESRKGFDKVPCQREIVDFEGHDNHGHDLVIANFADAILQGSDLIAPAEEGLGSIMINNGIILSAHKRETVSLPIDGDEFADLLQLYIEKSAKEPLGA